MERFTDLDGNELERNGGKICVLTFKLKKDPWRRLFVFFSCRFCLWHSWHGNYVGILIYSLVWDVWMILISPGHVSETRLDPPKNVRPGLDQSDINLESLRLYIPSDFIQHVVSDTCYRENTRMAYALKSVRTVKFNENTIQYLLPIR